MHEHTSGLLTEHISINAEYIQTYKCTYNIYTTYIHVHIYTRMHMMCVYRPPGLPLSESLTDMSEPLEEQQYEKPPWALRKDNNKIE